MELFNGAFVELESSALARVGYVDGDQHLHIEFRDGSAYVYLNVPATVFRGLISAESHGVYFNRRIRNAFASVPTPCLG